MYVALILSQNNVGGCLRTMDMSLRRYCIHANLEDVSARVQYSAYVLLRAIMGCFLDDQEMR